MLRRVDGSSVYTVAGSELFTSPPTWTGRCVPPNPLAQQATLETRDAKHEPRTLNEQRAAWHAQAAETLGGPDAVQALIKRTLNPVSMTSRRVDAEWLMATAENVLEAVEERRSTWQSWHVRAEAHRHVRAAELKALYPTFMPSFASPNTSRSQLGRTKP